MENSNLYNLYPAMSSNTCFHVLPTELLILLTEPIVMYIKNDRLHNELNVIISFYNNAVLFRKRNIKQKSAWFPIVMVQYHVIMS